MVAAPLLLALALTTSAATANPYLNDAQALYDALRFREAITKLEIARQVPTNDLGQKLRILDLLARSQLAEGNRPAAEAAYAEMLSLDPHVQLDRSLSPKILDAFDAAKARMFARDYVVLKQLPAPPGMARVELIDPWGRAEVLLVFRRARGEQTFQIEREPAVDAITALELSNPRSPVTEWYALVRGKKGELLAQVGSPEQPFVDSVVSLPDDAPPPELEEVPPAAVPVRPRPAPTSGPEWKEEVGVGALSLAVLAAGAGTYLQIRSRQLDRDARASPWADEAQRLHQQSLRQARWSIGLFAGAGLAGIGGAYLFFW